MTIATETGLERRHPTGTRYGMLQILIYIQNNYQFHIIGTINKYTAKGHPLSSVGVKNTTTTVLQGMHIYTLDLWCGGY